MSEKLDTNSFHKYLFFLAGEVKMAIQCEADKDTVTRMHVEVQTLSDRCASSSLPPELVSDLMNLWHNYLSKAATIPIRATLFDGSISLITRFSFNYARKQRQLQVLQGLLTDLETLAMHVKMRY